MFFYFLVFCFAIGAYSVEISKRMVALFLKPVDSTSTSIPTYTYILYMYILQYTVYAIDIAYGWKIKHERSRDRQGTKTRSSVIENVRVPTNRERLVRASFAIIHPKVARMPPHRDTCQVQIDGNENNGRRSLWKKSMQFSSTCNRPDFPSVQFYAFPRSVC